MILTSERVEVAAGGMELVVRLDIFLDARCLDGVKMDMFR